MTHRSTWKRRERDIASYWGTRRTPMSGGTSGHTRSDTLHPSLYVEAKLRASHSVVSLWDDTARRAAAENKTPVVTLCVKDRPGFWVLVHSRDLTRVADEHRRAQVSADRSEGSELDDDAPDALGR